VDPALFLRELFANRRRGLRRAWAPALATLLIGVSAGLPLLLFLRREE